jgi:hypothetical protein
MAFVPDDARTPKTAYADATRTVEAALSAAAQAQWNGNYPDLHRQRRALIELRRTVPNDRLDPASQVVRDLITTYAAVLEELSRRNTYERQSALPQTLRDDLARLRPRAARIGLAVLTDDLRGFRVGRVRDATEQPRPARPAPARRAAPPAAAPTTPAGSDDGSAPPRRRRRRRPVRP